VDFARTKNQLVRIIIDDCIQGRYGSVNELYSRHYTVSNGEAMVGAPPQIMNAEARSEAS